MGLELLSDDVFVSGAGRWRDGARGRPRRGRGGGLVVPQRPLPAKTVVFGEVGLAGEVRGTGQARCASGRRRRWASRAASSPPQLPAEASGIELVGVGTLEEALTALMEPAARG